MKIKKLDKDFGSMKSAKDIIKYLHKKAEKLDILSQCQEIERKWLVSHEILDMLMRNYPLKSDVQMERIYASVDPELRISCAWPSGKPAKNVKYKVTTKSTGKLEREEIEFELTSESATSLTNKIAELVGSPAQHPIKKHKWTFLIDGLKYELNSVDDGAFFYLEIEFESADDGIKFFLPNEFYDYVLLDVTYDDFWKMANYWAKSRLQESGECLEHELKYERIRSTRKAQDTCLDICFQKDFFQTMLKCQNKRRTPEFEKFIVDQIFQLACILGYMSDQPSAQATTLQEALVEMPRFYPPSDGFKTLPEAIAGERYRRYVSCLQEWMTMEGLCILQTFLPICAKTLNTELSDEDKSKILFGFYNSQNNIVASDSNVDEN